MIRNYLKIAIRNLMRHKGYTAINILGLGIGLACFMIISTYVKDELSFDKWHKKGDRIYRVVLERSYPGRTRDYAIIPHSYAETIKDEYPEVEDATRLFYFAGNPIVIKHNNVIYEESKYMWADSNFFNIFDLTLLEGNPVEALIKPQSVILTKTLAKKYFKDASPIGQTLDIPQNDNDFTVTGVIEDVPLNSHLAFDMLISSKSLGFIEQPNYISFSALTYLLLHPEADPQRLESKFPDLVLKFASGQILNNFGVDYAEYQKQGNGYNYSLQPLEGIYLNSNLESEIKPPGSKQRVYFFMIIAVLILIIACINFMNLATARSASRAKEVGIRKTLGSDRSQIAFQFFTEALLVSLISGMIALLIHYIAIPYFNTLTDKSFDTSDILNPQYIMTLLGLTGLTGILSGTYPAIALSAFKPIEVLRGQFSKTKKGIVLRNSLVVFQFGISVFLIISTIIVYHQMIYAQNKELGFDKDHLITLKGAGGMTESQEETFKNEIRALPGVEAVSGCNTQPGGTYFGISFKPPSEAEMTSGSALIVDDGYVECMKMKIISGRSFAKEFADSLSVVINESAAREMNLSEPIGKQLVSPANFLNSIPEVQSMYTIVGVIEDFHFQSLHQEISPLFLISNLISPNPGVDNLITVRMNPNSFQSSLTGIEGLWNRFQPDLPFRYAFLDREWSKLYGREMTARKVFSAFSILAIFIACLGLLALAAFTAEQRVKEIGIRKVLGASSFDIVRLLSKDFLKLVIISIFLASPIAWYVMNNWLKDFAYRVSIEWWVFIFAGIISILIAFFTVSFQSIRAARANPVESLKSE